ncbi:cell division protein FtsN [Glaesserella sp.]|uniref:cell division protein FtsN n=1 Tax=Glaesserella sp. TaxID=2094731 RepID=UPI0035A1266C
MPSRDYAARSKSKKRSGNKVLILAIVILLFMVSGLALWMLKEKAPAPTIPTQTVQPQQQPKSTLPTPPEEVYSYIRDLETREVPVDKNSKLAQLTKEQEQQILKQREEELRKQQASQQVQTTPEQSVQQTTDTQSQQTVTVLTPEQLEAKKAQEQKAAEEKRKQAELKKQQEAAKKVESTKTATPKPTETTKTGGKFGLQCGAFKNKAQAENMQARLAMAGYNARISSSGEWNRVFVGPIGDRAAASAAQSNARSVAECLIVGM